MVVTTEQLMADFLAKGGTITQIQPRKKDPVFFPRNKGAVAKMGRKAVQLGRQRNPKG